MKNNKFFILLLLFIFPLFETNTLYPKKETNIQKTIGPKQTMPTKPDDAEEEPEELEEEVEEEEPEEPEEVDEKEEVEDVDVDEDKEEVEEEDDDEEKDDAQVDEDVDEEEDIDEEEEEVDIEIPPDQQKGLIQFSAKGVSLKLPLIGTVSGIDITGYYETATDEQTQTTTQTKKPKGRLVFEGALRKPLKVGLVTITKPKVRFATDGSFMIRGTTTIKAPIFGEISVSARISRTKTNEFVFRGMIDSKEPLQPFKAIPIPAMKGILIDKPYVGFTLGKDEKNIFIGGNTSILGLSAIVKLKIASGNKISLVATQPPEGWDLGKIAAPLSPLKDVLSGLSIIASSYAYRDEELGINIGRGLTFAAKLDVSKVPGIDKLFQEIKFKPEPCIFSGTIGTPKDIAFSGTLPINLPLMNKKFLHTKADVPEVILKHLEISFAGIPPEFSFKCGVQVKPRAKDKPLLFTGAFTIDTTGQFGIEGSMVGPWVNPFGIPGITLEDVGLEFGARPNPPPVVIIPQRFGFTGMTAIGDKKDPAKQVKAQFTTSFDIKQPQSMVFHAKLDKLSLRNIASIPGNVGIKIPVDKLPNLKIDKVEYGFSPFGGSVKVGEVIKNFPAGITMRGRVEILNKFVECEFTINTTPGPDFGIRAIGMMSNFNIGPFKVSGAGEDGIYGTPDDGPTFQMILTPLKQKLFISGLMDFFESRGNVEVGISLAGIDIETKVKLFNVFDTTFSAHTSKLEDLTKAAFDTKGTLVVGRQRAKFTGHTDVDKTTLKFNLNHISLRDLVEAYVLIGDAFAKDVAKATEMATKGAAQKLRKKKKKVSFRLTEPHEYFCMSQPDTIALFDRYKIAYKPLAQIESIEELEEPEELEEESLEEVAKEIEEPEEVEKVEEVEEVEDVEEKIAPEKPIIKKPRIGIPPPREELEVKEEELRKRLTPKQEKALNKLLKIIPNIKFKGPKFTITLRQPKFLREAAEQFEGSGIVVKTKINIPKLKLFGHGHINISRRGLFCEAAMKKWKFGPFKVTGKGLDKKLGTADDGPVLRIKIDDSDSEFYLSGIANMFGHTGAEVNFYIGKDELSFSTKVELLKALSAQIHGKAGITSKKSKGFQLDGSINMGKQKIALSGFLGEDIGKTVLIYYVSSWKMSDCIDVINDICKATIKIRPIPFTKLIGFLNRSIEYENVHYGITGSPIVYEGKKYPAGFSFDATFILPYVKLPVRTRASLEIHKETEKSGLYAIGNTKNIEFGPLKIYGVTPEGVESDGGPIVHLRLSTKPTFYIDGAVELFGIKSKTRVDISEKGMSFNVEGSLAGLFQTKLIAHTVGTTPDDIDFIIEGNLQNDFYEKVRAAIVSESKKMREGTKKGIAEAQAEIQKISRAITPLNKKIRQKRGKINQLRRVMNNRIKANQAKIRRAQQKVWNARKGVDKALQKIGKARRKLQKAQAKCRKLKWPANKICKGLIAGAKKALRNAERAASVGAKAVLASAVAGLEAVKRSAVIDPRQMKETAQITKLTADIVALEAAKAPLVVSRETAKGTLEVAKQTTVGLSKITEGLATGVLDIEKIIDIKKVEFYASLRKLLEKGHFPTIKITATTLGTTKAVKLRFDVKNPLKSIKKIAAGLLRLAFSK
jgi:hypothetical protein